jgi:hypothetical protein
MLSFISHTVILVQEIATFIRYNFRERKYTDAGSVDLRYFSAYTNPSSDFFLESAAVLHVVYCTFAYE